MLLKLAGGILCVSLLYPWHLASQKSLQPLLLPDYPSPSLLHGQCSYKRQENEEHIKGPLYFLRWGERAEHGVFCPNFVMKWKLRTAGLLYHKWYQPVSPRAITFIKMSVCEEENKQKAHHCPWKRWWLNHYFIPESLRWSERAL